MSRHGEGIGSKEAGELCWCSGGGSDGVDGDGAHKKRDCALEEIQPRCFSSVVNLCCYKWLKEIQPRVV